MSDRTQQAVSRILTIKGNGELTPGILADETVRMVNTLAEKLSIKDVVPGHIKALVGEGDFLAMVNCTRRGGARVKLPEGWEEADLRHPTLRLSIIIVGLPAGSAESALAEALSSSGLDFEG